MVFVIITKFSIFVEVGCLDPDTIIWQSLWYFSFQISSWHEFCWFNLTSPTFFKKYWRILLACTRRERH